MNIRNSKANDKTLADQLAWIWYPLVLLTVLALHRAILEQGFAILYSTYVPVFLAALSIIALEIYFPYCRDWLPNKNDVINDSIFMATVQLVLPQCLVFLVALIVVHSLPYDIWPRELPVVVQVILMVLIADFLRYWFHVASHHFMPLWQLHAVHHSPHKLYWLNVGRFHPVEKTMQFMFDSLPFIILGVGEEVLAMYFVFYAANGYFQHSNVYLKMGFLNYIISSAELHRWHHSVLIHQANRNYGNNIIIWDLLFGTYFFPKDQSVKELGLKNRNYPATFMKQMKTPFILRLESINLPVISYREIVINLLLRLRFLYLYLSKRTKIINATHYPKKHQLKVLNEIIQANTGSQFGKDHHFETIHDYQSYRRHCPITTYDALAKYIDIDDIGNHGLTTEKPIFYQVTSGTTSASKYLPVTETGIYNDHVEQYLVALARYLDNPGTFVGKIFAVVSPAVEGYTNSGVPFGSASGLAYQNMPALSRQKYVVPYAIFDLTDYDLKYFLIALFALAESRVTLIATANPSTLVHILDIINTHAEQLLTMLETGIIDTSVSLDASIHNRFAASPEWAHHLKKIYTNKGRLSYKDIWPYLQALVTWTGGSCGIPLTALKNDLHEDIKITEMGYLASEIRGTITFQYNLGIPTFQSNFFEFITVDDWEFNRDNIKLLHELQRGQLYFIIVTTVNGLYRYFMNDIIEVTEFINQIPTFRFIQKGYGVTNITGEKLYECQILEAIKTMEQTHHISVLFHQWLANEEIFQYQVFIELAGKQTVTTDQLADTLQTALTSQNIEYQQKTSDGRLKPLELKLLKTGTGEVYKQYKLNQGQREGQFKVLTLIYTKDSDFSFDLHLNSASDRA